MKYLQALSSELFVSDDPHYLHGTTYIETRHNGPCGMRGRPIYGRPSAKAWRNKQGLIPDMMSTGAYSVSAKVSTEQENLTSRETILFLQDSIQHLVVLASVGSIDLVYIRLDQASSSLQDNFLESYCKSTSRRLHLPGRYAETE